MTTRSRDITAAIKALEGAGYRIAAVEMFPDGRWRVSTTEEKPVIVDEVEAAIRAHEAEHSVPSRTKTKAR